MENADLSTQTIIDGLKAMDHLMTELARLRLIDLQAVCQLAHDFYNLPTTNFVAIYGSGISTRDLGDKFREVLGLEKRS